MNTVASLFNLAGPDLIIILGIVLLLFGAKKLPELARGMGQAVREFSKAKDEFEREVTRPPELPAKPPEDLKASQDYDHPEVAHAEEVTIEEAPGKQEHKSTLS